ncbi:hypothetical protein U5922_005260 [Aquicoccus sp. G2-2]|uniref:hypothetical protein n=1 Tax=Aquicoccus sp. G2-2 TaxID=3092120 RepID=UPI00366F9C04
MTKLCRFALLVMMVAPFALLPVAPFVSVLSAETPPQQAQPSGENTTGEGLSLMQEGAKLFMRGILNEMEPAMEDLRSFSGRIEPGLRSFVQEMGPALGEILGKIDDFSAYHPPEMLPNGDIIIRRKSPIEQKQGNPDGNEIEL